MDVNRIYQEYGAMVLRRARTILGDDAEAHEVLQDVFLDLLERPEQYAGHSALTTWLYSVTSHACFNRIRRKRNRSSLLQRWFSGSRESTLPPSAESKVYVRGILSRLPENLAMVMIYRHLEGMTQDEIAEVLCCSRKHVGHLLHRLEARLERMGVSP